MNEAINLIKLQHLMNRTDGSPDISIALIDGPVLTDSPVFNKKNIQQITGTISATCLKADSVACGHGTFIAGVLCAMRGSVVPAICPGCTLLIRSIFSEQVAINELMPSTTPKELAHAIFDSINAGARIINLSLALANPACKSERELEDALNYACKQGVIVVVAAGNQGTIGSTAITRHPWVIPVIACNRSGNPLQLCNLGNSIGKNGLCAPGENITSIGTNNQPVTFSGTSVAVPFVTGTIALLWSAFPYLPASIIKQAVNNVNNRRSLTPPLINAAAAFQYLDSQYTKKAVA